MIEIGRCYFFLILCISIISFTFCLDTLEILDHNSVRRTNAFSDDTFIEIGSDSNYVVQAGSSGILYFYLSVGSNLFIESSEYREVLALTEEDIEIDPFIVNRTMVFDYKVDGDTSYTRAIIYPPTFDSYVNTYLSPEELAASTVDSAFSYPVSGASVGEDIGECNPFPMFSGSTHLVLPVHFFDFESVESTSDVPNEIIVNVGFGIDSSTMYGWFPIYLVGPDDTVIYTDIGFTGYFDVELDEQYNYSQVTVNICTTVVGSLGGLECDINLLLLSVDVVGNIRIESSEEARAAGWTGTFPAVFDDVQLFDYGMVKASPGYNDKIPGQVQLNFQCGTRCSQMLTSTPSTAGDGSGSNDMVLIDSLTFSSTTEIESYRDIRAVDVSMSGSGIYGVGLRSEHRFFIFGGNSSVIYILSKAYKTLASSLGASVESSTSRELLEANTAFRIKVREDDPEYDDDYGAFVYYTMPNAASVSLVKTANFYYGANMFGVSPVYLSSAFLSYMFSTVNLSQYSLPIPLPVYVYNATTDLYARSSATYLQFETSQTDTNTVLVSVGLYLSSSSSTALKTLDFTIASDSALPTANFYYGANMFCVSPVYLSSAFLSYMFSTVNLSQYSLPIPLPVYVYNATTDLYARSSATYLQFETSQTDTNTVLVSVGLYLSSSSSTALKTLDFTIASDSALPVENIRTYFMPDWWITSTQESHVLVIGVAPNSTSSYLSSIAISVSFDYLGVIRTYSGYSAYSVTCPDFEEGTLNLTEYYEVQRILLFSAISLTNTSNFSYAYMNTNCGSSCNLEQDCVLESDGGVSCRCKSEYERLVLPTLHSRTFYSLEKAEEYVDIAPSDVTSTQKEMIEEASIQTLNAGICSVYAQPNSNVTLKGVKIADSVMLSSGATLLLEGSSFSVNNVDIDTPADNKPVVLDGEDAMGTVRYTDGDGESQVVCVIPHASVITYPSSTAPTLYSHSSDEYAPASFPSFEVPSNYKLIRSISVGTCEENTSESVCSLSLPFSFPILTSSVSELQLQVGKIVFFDSDGDSIGSLIPVNADTDASMKAYVVQEDKTADDYNCINDKIVIYLTVDTLAFTVDILITISRSGVIELLYKMDETVDIDGRIRTTLTIDGTTFTPVLPDTSTIDSTYVTYFSIPFVPSSFMANLSVYSYTCYDDSDNELMCSFGVCQQVGQDSNNILCRCGARFEGDSCIECGGGWEDDEETTTTSSSSNIITSNFSTGDYDSMRCSIPTCEYYGECNGNGTCTGVATSGEQSCECDAGYIGDECAQATPEVCDDIACENGGQCVDGSCVCAFGYSGSTCSEMECVVDDSVTNCNSVYSDSTCDTSTGSCECADNWSGDECSTYTATGDCINGVLNGTDCVCSGDYTGMYCQCNNSCNNNGLCREWGCECFSGYYGDDCSEALSPNFRTHDYDSDLIDYYEDEYDVTVNLQRAVFTLHLHSESILASSRDIGQFDCHQYIYIHDG
ncbi:hypothetical protein ADUPG1_014136, partial [Aduncisulcus paluster]